MTLITAGAVSDALHHRNTCGTHCRILEETYSTISFGAVTYPMGDGSTTTVGTAITVTSGDMRSTTGAGANGKETDVAWYADGCVCGAMYSWKTGAINP